MIEAVLRRSEGRMYRGYARVFVRRHGDINDDFSTEISFIHDLVITEESIGYEDSYGQLHPVEVRSDCLFSLRQLSKQERKFLYDEAVLNAMDYRVVFYMKSIAGEAKLIRQYENQYISPVLKQSSRSQYQVQLSMLFSPSEANEHFETIEPPIPPMFVYPAVNDTELSSSDVVKVRVRVQAGGRLFLGVRVQNTVTVLEQWDSIADVVNGWSVSSVGGFLEKEFEYISSERGLRYEFFGYVRYFNQDSPQSEWLVRRRFSAPVLSGFPTSVVVPTMVSFQGFSTRGTGNELASQVEFEWLVNSVFQSNVPSFYNLSGDAQGIFTLPSNINTAGLIRVRGRSKNAQVVGEWSDYQDINITLFRPLPIINFFQANASSVALNAQPPSQVNFNFQIAYSDAFNGACTWAIWEVDANTNTLISSVASGSQPTNPIVSPFLVNQPLSLPSFTNKTTVTYRLIATNPNNQSVEQDFYITYIPRPSLTKLRFFFNPNIQTYKYDSNTQQYVPATSQGDPIALIQDEINPSVWQLEQQNFASQPVLRALSNNRFFIQGSLWRYLKQPSTQNTFSTHLPDRDEMTWIFVSNFATADRILEVFWTGNSGTAIWFSAFSIREFSIGTNIAPIMNLPSNIHNIVQVCAVTYKRNSTYKIYSSGIVDPLNTSKIVGQQNTNNNTLAGAGNTQMRVCVTYNNNITVEVGHVIVFERELSSSEVLSWFEWLSAYYQLPYTP